MCTLPTIERYHAMDDMGDIHNVVLPVPTQAIHELEAHVTPIPNNPLRAFVRGMQDFFLMCPVHQSLLVTRAKAWASRQDWSLVWVCLLCIFVVLTFSVAVIGLGATLGYPALQHLADLLHLPRD